MRSSLPTQQSSCPNISRCPHAAKPSRQRCISIHAARREVTLLDYGAGNVRSVRNAIKKLGYTIKDVSFCCCVDGLPCEALICTPHSGLSDIAQQQHLELHTKAAVTPEWQQNHWQQPSHVAARISMQQRDPPALMLTVQLLAATHLPGNSSSRSTKSTSEAHSLATAGL